jgi:hypothetical protein
MEVEIALFIHDMKNLRQSISRSESSFVDVPPARENASNKMLAIFYRTASDGGGADDGWLHHVTGRGGHRLPGNGLPGSYHT